MRGEICIGAATFLSFVSVILLIFAHIGQINTSTIPRGISMVNVNVSQYGDDLHAAIFDPVDGLYNFTPNAPLGEGLGLRQNYEWGLYSYCAYVNGSQGVCTSASSPMEFQPFAAILADMPANYSGLTQDFIPSDLTFTNSHYLGEFSHAAYYLLLLGTICAFLAMVIGIPKHTIAYFTSTLFAIFGALLLLIGATMWTVIIIKTESINNAEIIPSGSSTASLPLGIVVSVGPGLWLFWGAFVALLLSIIPYMISCCTFRG